jgi:Domain of unknown function (DUF4417)
MSSNDRPKPIFHSSDVPPSLGCLRCPDLQLCGGLQTREGVFNCEYFCDCLDRSACQRVCRRKLLEYIDRVHEIRGFDFRDIPRYQPAPTYFLPYVVPHIYHRSKRVGELNCAAVSISLGQLFDHQSGLAKYTSKAEVAKAFRFSPTAALIINGVGEDQPIEHYWTHRRATALPQKLALLSPALVTTPNYSVFTNVPRWDNMFSMKRIAICWSELVAAGIPASLHLNARTDQDWRRWMEFLGEREEVNSVTFEFATGAALKDRAGYHIDKLVTLAHKVDRNLQLVVRGGYIYLKELADAFSQVVFIDTTAFMKTMKRKRLDWTPGQKKHWHSALTAKDLPLDNLLRHNVYSHAAMIASERFVPSPSQTHAAVSSDESFFDERQGRLF